MLGRKRIKSFALVRVPRTCFQNTSSFAKLVVSHFLFVAVGFYAQKSTFVRVYNSSGVKISSGHILIVTDSSLQLSEEKSNIIPLSSIDYIKTKHSESTNLIIGSILGATAGAILGGGMYDGELHLNNFNRNKATVVGMIASPWFVSHEPAFKTHLALRNL